MRNKELQLFNETLIKFKFFKNLYDAWKKSCHEKVYILNYKKGERIINYGKPAGAFFMVGFGTITLMVKDPAAPEGEKEVRELVAGGFFGGGLLSGQPRSFSALAHEDSLIFIMARKDFLQMVEDNFDVKEIIQKHDFQPESTAGATVTGEGDGKKEMKPDIKEGKSIISRLRGYLKLKKD